MLRTATTLGPTQCQRANEAQQAHHRDCAAVRAAPETISPPRVQLRAGRREHPASLGCGRNAIAASAAVDHGTGEIGSHTTATLKAPSFHLTAIPLPRWQTPWFGSGAAWRLRESRS